MCSFFCGTVITCHCPQYPQSLAFFLLPMRIVYDAVLCTSCELNGFLWSVADGRRHFTACVYDSSEIDAMHSTEVPPIDFLIPRDIFARCLFLRGSLMSLSSLLTPPLWVPLHDCFLRFACRFLLHCASLIPLCVFLGLSSNFLVILFSKTFSLSALSLSCSHPSHSFPPALSAVYSFHFILTLLCCQPLSLDCLLLCAGSQPALSLRRCFTWRVFSVQFPPGWCWWFIPTCFLTCFMLNLSTSRFMYILLSLLPQRYIRSLPGRISRFPFTFFANVEHHLWQIFMFRPFVYILFAICASNIISATVYNAKQTAASITFFACAALCARKKVSHKWCWIARHGFVHNEVGLERLV